MPPRKSPARKKTGPKPKPADQKSVIVSTSVPYEVSEYLRELGGGKLTAGLRMAAMAEFNRRPTA